MRRATDTRLGMLNHALAVCAPLVVFVIMLLLPIPYKLSHLLWSYSVPLFLLVLVAYYLSFRLPRGGNWLFPASLTMLLLGLGLHYLWSSGYSDDKIVAGLLPFRDAFDYYNGAKLLLSGNLIQTLNEGAAWRPLYPGFLASLLWITGQNLQWALAIQVGLAGLCYVLAAGFLRDRLGALAAAIYLALIYFYIQPLIGTAYTETLGLALGSLGFILLWRAAETQRMGSLAAGLAMLMVAVSERAGAFFVFPVLVLWAAWAFRADKRLSWRHGMVALAMVVGTYLLVNPAYRKMLVEPGSSAFGNFAFTLYGQVAGGAGYHKAFEELSVRDPAVILRAAERFFVAHPFSFVIGAAKAYRDFFLPGGVLSFGPGALDGLIWIAGIALLLLGLYRLFRTVRSPESSLLLAVFVGLLLSIPFLPPIDGGVRIYASTMPFLYALPAFAVARSRTAADSKAADWHSGVTVASVLLVTLTVVTPVLIIITTPRPAVAATTCALGSASFTAILSSGSYIDLVPEGAGSCGGLPDVCLTDFRANRNSNDPSDVTVFDQLVAQAQVSTVRVFAANNLLDKVPHLFAVPVAQLVAAAPTVVSGCAVEIRLPHRPSLYQIQSLQSK